MESDRRKSRSCSCALVSVLLLAGVCVAIAAVYNALQEGIRDVYAGLQVGNVIIEHMETNAGAWPGNWEDLRESHATVYARGNNSESFDSLQTRVEIDFDVDPAKLTAKESASGRPPFCVVRPRRGDTFADNKRFEPNQLILDYLKSKNQPHETNKD